MSDARAGRRLSTTAVMLAATLLVAGAGAAEAQSWRSVTMSRQRSGEAEMDVEIRYGAGRFRVRSADEGLLYRMELRYDEELFEPVADYRDGHLELGTRSVDGGINLGNDRSSGELNVTLARGVPMDLDLEFGAVRADLDLGGLSLTRLELATGASESRIAISEPNPSEMRRARFEVGAAEFHARHLGNLNAESIEVDAGVGEVTLDFTGEWRRDATAEIGMGLGSLELRFPRGIGVKLEKDSFLTSLDSEGLVKRGDAYYSLDWDEAERRITLEVDAALGSIEVVWLR